VLEGNSNARPTTTQRQTFESQSSSRSYAKTSLFWKLRTLFSAGIYVVVVTHTK